MPDLPTITVTDAQAVRCLAAWGSVAAYKSWLQGQVVDYVKGAERAAALADVLAAQQAALAAIDTTDLLDGAV